MLSIIAGAILNNTLLLNWITLMVTILTLIIVFFQTIYTKKTLEKTQKSIELYKISKQLEILPRVNFIIEVTMFLNKWNDELQEIIKLINENDIDKIIDFSKRKQVKSEGLIDKYLYEKMPQWLAVIYETGAQYYYNSSCMYKHLWDEKNNKLFNTKLYLDRLKESSYFLEVLLQYVKDEVPEVFLNAPAKLNTNDFFEK
ncbi:MAG: hypothetical protein WC349_04215 [Patescibacteria group bacterium]|jgi:hypothetical protein